MSYLPPQNGSPLRRRSLSWSPLYLQHQEWFMFVDWHLPTCSFSCLSPSSRTIPSMELLTCWFGTKPTLLRMALFFQMCHASQVHSRSRVLNVSLTPSPPHPIPHTVLRGLAQTSMLKHYLLFIWLVGIFTALQSPRHSLGLTVYLELFSFLWFMSRLTLLGAWLWCELHSRRPFWERTSMKSHWWSKFPDFMFNVNTGKYIIIKHYYHL